MKNIFIYLLFLFSLKIEAQDLPNNITKEDKVYFLSLFWSEAKYNYVNMNKITFSWDSLYHVYLRQVIQTPNDYEYYQTLQKFAACLRDGHTEIINSGRFYKFQDYPSVIVKNFNKKLYVTALKKTIGVDSSLIGSEIIEIDTVSTTKYLETFVFPYISASTDQSLWNQGVFSLHLGLKTNPFKITCLKSDGKVIKVVLPRNGETTRNDSLDKYWGILPHYSRNIIDLTWKGKNAILCYNRFNPEDKAIEAFTKLLPALYNAEGLIIDLRSNGGGSTAVGWNLLKYIVREPYFLGYGWETRINDGVKKANGNWKKEYSEFYKSTATRFVPPDTIRIPDTLKRLKMPIVILVGNNTFSAAEDFLVTLYEIKNRPYIIGSPTGGSTGSPLVIPDFPGGGYARICTRRINYPISKKAFVNEGVKPDMLIEPTIIDYLNNNDVILEKALEKINTKPDNMN